MKKYLLTGTLLLSAPLVFSAELINEDFNGSTTPAGWVAHSYTGGNHSNIGNPQGDSFRFPNPGDDGFLLLTQDSGWQRSTLIYTAATIDTRDSFSFTADVNINSTSSGADGLSFFWMSKDSVDTVIANDASVGSVADIVGGIGEWQGAPHGNDPGKPVGYYPDIRGYSFEFDHWNNSGEVFIEYTHFIRLRDWDHSTGSVAAKNFGSDSTFYYNDGWVRLHFSYDGPTETFSYYLESLEGATQGDVSATVTFSIGDLESSSGETGWYEKYDEAYFGIGAATGGVRAEHLVDNVLVLSSADLELTSNGDDPDPVLAGAPLSGLANLRHDFTLTNNGPAAADSVSVDFSASSLPAGVTYVAAIPDSGTSFANDTWTVGTLAAGASVDLLLYYEVDSSAASCGGCISISGAASTTTPDSDSTNDSASESTSIMAPVDQSTGFETSIDFDNNATDSVTVTLTCNAGLPLEQSFEISEGSNVLFTMNNLPFTTPGTRCEITATDAEGYSLTAVANGGDPAESCVFEADSFSGTFNLAGANTCVFSAVPGPTAITVNTIFENIPNDDIASDVNTSFQTVISCDDVSVTSGSSFGPVQETDTTGTFTADWYADPDGGADCTVVLYPDSDAVEGDSCEFSFELGDEEAGCDVVGTIFFEGIPTLSQYGMALMALLMLGIGFVAVRRTI